MYGRKAIIFLMIWMFPTLAARAQVQVHAQLIQRDLRVFFLSDLNLSGRGTSANEIFALTIQNTSPLPQTARLWVGISSMRLGELAAGITRPFALPGGALMRLTNQNLFTQAQQFALQEYQILDNGSQLRDRVLKLGKLPSDIYRFTFVIKPAEGDAELSSTFIEIDVSNPTSLDLIGPGSPAERDAPAVITGTQPIFRWTSNMDQYKLILAEKLPGVHDSASPAEIIQDRIRFERTFTLDPARAGAFSSDGGEYISVTAYPYPAFGAWPLEPGKIYYWQITGMAPSSGAPLELPSEIWSFIVHDASAAMGALSDEALLAQLRALLGDDLETFFRAGGALDGFTPSGLFMLNGRWISREQIRAILAKIASGEYTLIESRVE